MNENHTTSIRRLHSGDEETARQLLLRIKTTPTPTVALPATESFVKLLQRDDVYLLVAGPPAEPTGFLLAYRLPRLDRDCDMVCLYELEVHPRHRRQGIGKSLVRAMMAICRKSTVMKMWVSTAATNRAASALYTATGFNPKGGAASLEFSWTREVCEEEEKEPTVPDF
ncbi:MAG: GNAT family N-acetyltransferase [Candidatus Delongbacteria bacterium]|nr:GNAT family N-acetyltransferase [bacterium]MBL7033023.1 GNAT family N-acetyltransferase [Candidatus Delongbacteria bacterium]